MKKEETRFTIKFNNSIPSHRKAIEALNNAGRKKAELIASLVTKQKPNFSTTGNMVDYGRIETIVLEVLKNERNKAQLNHHDSPHYETEQATNNGDHLSTAKTSTNSFEIIDDLGSYSNKGNVTACVDNQDDQELDNRIAKEVVGILEWFKQD